MEEPGSPNLYRAIRRSLRELQSWWDDRSHTLYYTQSQNSSELHNDTSSSLSPDLNSEPYQGIPHLQLGPKPAFSSLCFCMVSFLPPQGTFQ